jgi:hypothetical protein
VVGNRRQACLAEVHDIEVVATELTQVLLDLAPQLLGPHHAGGTGAHLGGDHQVTGYGESAARMTSLAQPRLVNSPGRIPGSA